MICDDVERDLEAYVDREIGPEAAAAIREHLAGCVACRRRVADRDALGRLVRAAPYHSAPDRLRARVSAQLSQTRRRRRLATWAAAAALVVSITGGVAVARWTRATGEGRTDAVVAEVVDGHVRSLMADHLFDVQSTDQHTVKPWFLGKLDFSPPVADLSAIGFPLVGGRVDYLSERHVAALVYQRNKHTINVFVWPAGDATPAATTRSVRGFHVHHWVRDAMSFWAVSDLNEKELTEFVAALP